MDDKVKHSVCTDYSALSMWVKRQPNPALAKCRLPTSRHFYFPEFAVLAAYMFVKGQKMEQEAL